MNIQNSKKEIIFKPVHDDKDLILEIEKELEDLFFKELIKPLVDAINLGDDLLVFNAKKSETGLQKALKSGSISYQRGMFIGKLDSSLTKELIKLGAKFDKSKNAFYLTKDKLPSSYVEYINKAESKYKEKLKRLDKELSNLSKKNLSKNIDSDALFSKAYKRIEKRTKASLEAKAKSISFEYEIPKKIEDELRKKWIENFDIGIKNFKDASIKKIRKSVRENVLAGNRSSALISEIQKTYNVSKKRAKFIARQETKLMNSRYKTEKYIGEGIYFYKWVNVPGTAKHPTRPEHKRLGDLSKAGKLFRFDKPPLKTDHGDLNPGEDYNCRCVAIPVYADTKEQK